MIFWYDCLEFLEECDLSLQHDFDTYVIFLDRSRLKDNVLLYVDEYYIDKIFQGFVNFN